MIWFVAAAGAQEPATGSFRAGPRADWPCAMREGHGTDPLVVRWRFVYGAVDRCTLRVADVPDGIVGCVERVVVERDGRAYDVKRLSYANGRVVRIESNSGDERIAWEGEVPAFEDEGAVDRRPGRITWSVIGRSIVDVDAQGRPLRVSNEEGRKVVSRCDYTWVGARLTDIRCADGAGEPQWRYALAYDCRDLPPLPPSVNRGGPLGVPVP